MSADRKGEGSSGPDPMPALEFVIVTFNSAHVIGCLASLPEGAAITIVDNASTDGTVDAALGAGRAVEVLSQRRNLGFGAAANRALRPSRAAYALLLNPDAVLLPGSSAALLTSAQKHPDAAIVVPLQYGFDGNVRSLSYLEHPWRRAGLFVVPDGECCVDVAPGTAMLLVLEKFRRQIGWFDERFFLYAEDTDLCLRVRSVGYSCILNPEAAVRHDPGNSCNLPDRRFQQYEFRASQYLFQRKYRIRRFVVLRSIVKSVLCLFRTASPRRRSDAAAELHAIARFLWRSLKGGSQAWRRA